MILDDVATRSPGQELELALDDVGLENVQTQVRLEGLLLPARAHAGVSLVDPRARGIHMSRLFRILNRLHEEELTWTWLEGCLDQMLKTHSELSDRGYIQTTFELPVLRRALLSQEQGWRNYPVTYKVQAHGSERVRSLTTRVLYSSTCPCSAGLSRQALQEKFLSDFAETGVSVDQVVAWLGRTESIVAVPHAQRSEAIVEFTLDAKLSTPSTLSLIDEIEMALGTPVQAAVKREDEQEFARRNAENLMFCEDAARKLKSALLKRSELSDFAIEVRHFESLHPHDVVARVRKGE